MEKGYYIAFVSMITLLVIIMSIFIGREIYIKNSCDKEEYETICVIKDYRYLPNRTGGFFITKVIADIGIDEVEIKSLKYKNYKKAKRIGKNNIAFIKYIEFSKNNKVLKREFLIK